jgi:outer membrane protein OmpA-like peptidoglycan-associated protein
MNQDAQSLDVRLDCGGKRFSRGGPASRGDKIELKLDLPQGKYTCRGELALTTAEGEGSMPLSYDVSVLPALGIRLEPGSLSLPDHKMTIVLDRPSSKVEVHALGIGGAELGTGLLPVEVPAGQDIPVEWKQTPGEVLKIKVRGFDSNGFWSELELNPWSYSIPHEDIVFATNMATIDATETPKLASAMDDARGVLKKYGADVVIKLYVGGHTDTVGDAASNQDLSMRRARAIAEWFKANGFPGDIYYQGYGESDLAVPTPDNTDEPKNRRASYILAAKPPEAQGGTGDYGWVKLK